MIFYSLWAKCIPHYSYAFNSFHVEIIQFSTIDQVQWKVLYKKGLLNKVVAQNLMRIQLSGIFELRHIQIIRQKNLCFERKKDW